MNNAEFELTIRRAIAGSEEDLELIFMLYEPLIYKYSCIKGEYNEDTIKLGRRMVVAREKLLKWLEENTAKL